MALSRQDEELAMAAVALYRAAQDSHELTDEEFANWCIKYACKSLEEEEVQQRVLLYVPPNTQTIAIFVYTVLHLDQNKLTA